ncbi:MAG: alpha-N-arabinofuranosidase [Solirubrobacteraceae bacterium]
MNAASVTVDRSARVAPVNRRLFGAFVEHLGRGVYGGIYEPGHPFADADGFRLDVIDLVRELGVSTLRYPGGNFVSGYRWEDGVGPQALRPARLDLAWHSLETNQIGLHEFATWAGLVDAELMLAVNLGTRGIENALDLLEYANHPSGTTLADARRRHGAEQPFGVRMWCLGNEMDGPWQLGHISANSYGSLAARTAAAMRMFDPTLELVLCGSSHALMPTFGEWERVVLEHCYPHVDYISLHAYYQERNGDTASFLASAVDLERFIEAVVATVEHVQHKLRQPKTIGLSVDEWNVWYLDQFEESGGIIDDWPQAPRLLEDVYTVADGVVVGSLLITLLKHSNHVRAASLAQLVNVIAPIMTEPRGPAWRQTTFLPFATTSRLATGDILRPHITCGFYETSRHGNVPVLDAVATHDAETELTSVFLVNRENEPCTVTIDLRDVGAKRLLETATLADEDPYAQNTLHDQTRVALWPNNSAQLAEGRISVTLPPISWTASLIAGRD